MPELIDGKVYVKLVAFTIVMLAIMFCSFATVCGAILNGAL